MKSEPTNDYEAMVFEVRTDPMDVTINGMFGGQPSAYREMVPGVCRYFVNNVGVTQAEYERLWQQQVDLRKG